MEAVWPSVVREVLPKTAHTIEDMERMLESKADFSFVLNKARSIHQKTPFLAANFSGNPDFARMFREHYVVDDVFMHVLHDAKMIGGTLVLDKDDNIIYPTTYHSRFKGKYQYHWEDIFDPFFLEWTGVLRGPPLPPVKSHIPGTSFHFSGLADAQFAHWMIQDVPNALFLQALKGLTPGLMEPRLIMPVDPQAISHRAEHLRLLGIHNEVMVVDNQPEVVQFERLLVPTFHRLPHLFKFSPEIIDIYRQIRQAAADENVNSGYRRIFLSRKDVGMRRGITNEAELAELAAEYGFEILDLGGKSVTEQVNIFKNAEIIVSAHGGAMMNMVYADPGATVLELTHEMVPNFWFYRLAGICDHDYAYLCAKIDEDQKEKDVQDINFFINKDDFRSVLESCVAHDDQKRGVSR